MTRLVALLFTCALIAARASAEPNAEQILEDVRAKYATLRTYADRGTVILEDKPIGATTIREQLTFVTRFAAPKQFYFDAKKSTGERFVIWCPGDSFHSWWSATQVHESYAPGEGANAFAMGSLPTAGTALLIAPLLFQSAGLQGPLVTMDAPRHLGFEVMNGRRMHKIRGNARLNHWTENVRSTTLWIDAETLLVHKIFEDTPSGMGSAIQRTTTTIEPVLTETFGPNTFRFVAPGQDD